MTGVAPPSSLPGISYWFVSAQTIATTARIKKIALEISSSRLSYAFWGILHLTEGRSKIDRRPVYHVRSFQILQTSSQDLWQQQGSILSKQLLEHQPAR
jgi:hypothetical protein